MIKPIRQSRGQTERRKKTKALLNSKIDLMEYFLGSDPKKTSYYRNNK